MSTMAPYVEVRPDALAELGWLLDQRGGYWIAINPILRITSEQCPTRAEAERAACLIQQAYGNGEVNEQLMAHASGDSPDEDLMIDSRKFKRSEDDGIEYWTTTNKSGIVELKILPMDDESYFEWVEPSLKGPITRSVKSYADYVRTFPRHTHIKVRRMQGTDGWTANWTFDACCSLDMARPIGESAKQVAGFDPVEKPTAQADTTAEGTITTQRVVKTELEDAGSRLMLGGTGWYAENTVTGQNGSGKHPTAGNAEAEAAKIDWGPAADAERGEEAGEIDPDLLDSGLWNALMWHAGAAGRWNELAARGASDGLLQERIAQEFGKSSMNNARFKIATNVRRGKPQFFFGTDQVNGMPTFEGEALITAVRRLLSIADVEAQGSGVSGQDSEQETAEVIRHPHDFPLVMELAGDPLLSSALDKLDVRMTPLFLSERDPEQPRELF